MHDDAQIKHDAQLSKWDVIDHWETNEHILVYLRVVLEDGWLPLVAISLVDIARATRVLDTSGNVPRGESILEKGIADACRPQSKEVLSEIQTAKMRLTKWDPIDHWETDEDIIRALQIALDDELPELTASALVDIARAKGLLDTSGETPRGESLLEKAIAESYRRHSQPSHIVPAKMQTS